MIYQVRATLFFDVEDEARDFYHDCNLAYLKAINLNPDAQNVEYSIIELIENNHDTSPTAPCDCIERRCSQPNPYI